jgi:hypothetical protein
MVDTVMRDDDWRRAYAASADALRAGADAALVVTPAQDDDAPLWVQLGHETTIVRIGGAPSTPPLVTGGVYAFGAVARARAVASLAAGRARMRGFLTDLVAGGADVRGVPVPRVIDVDHARDLAAARVLSSTPGPCR